MSFFSKNTVGLDIADTTLELVELEKRGKGARVASSSRITFGPGVVERGKIKDAQKLAQLVKSAFAKARPRPTSKDNVIFGLPESQVYTRLLEVELGSDEEIKKSIVKEAQTSIPVEPNDLLVDYRIISKSQGKVEVLLVATSKKIVQEWLEFFQKIGIEVTAFDIEMLAFARGIFSDSVMKPVCLVDIGRIKTNIAIFDGKGLRHSYSLAIAGDTFTAEISKALNLDQEEAERRKIEAGLSASNDKIYEAVSVQVEKIVEEIKSVLDYFGQKTGLEVGGVILVGGSGQMPGLVDYLRDKLGIEVSLGKTRIIKESMPLEYVEAVGLALRGLDKKWSLKDPSFSAASLNEKPGTEKEIPSISETDRETDNLEAEENEQGNANSRKVWLVIILVVGTVALMAAYWYRDYSRVKRSGELRSMISEYESRLDAVSKEMEKVETDKAAETVEEELPAVVLIKETETGYLNVRKDPDKESEILTKVNPGDTYLLLEETENWYKIEIAGQGGWISVEYAAKQEEVPAEENNN